MVLRIVGLDGGVAMQPTFVDLPEMKMVGFGTRFISILSPAKNNSATIPPLWHQFMGEIDRISNRVGRASWGLVEMLPNDANKSHPDEMFYIAAAEVADLSSVPEGMLRRIVPAGRYALFTHVGSLDGLARTMIQIYSQWLPKSGVQLRNAPHLERYDSRFDPRSDKSEFDILLPVVST
jgi:AraC family transcriptional regulator